MHVLSPSWVRIVCWCWLTHDNKDWCVQSILCCLIVVYADVLIWMKMFASPDYLLALLSVLLITFTTVVSFLAAYPLSMFWSSPSLLLTTLPSLTLPSVYTHLVTVSPSFPLSCCHHTLTMLLWFPPSFTHAAIHIHPTFPHAVIHILNIHSNSHLPYTSLSHKLPQSDKVLLRAVVWLPKVSHVGQLTTSTT